MSSTMPEKPWRRSEQRRQTTNALIGQTVSKRRTNHVVAKGEKVLHMERTGTYPRCIRMKTLSSLFFAFLETKPVMNKWERRRVTVMAETVETVPRA